MEKNTSLRYICRECSFPGRAYIPRDQDVRGGVLVLHGSEGGGFGAHDRTAVLLACHGFTALAYDWCGSYERPVDGLSSKVVDIAIEGPVKALRWLRRHESVRNTGLWVRNCCTGRELARRYCHDLDLVVRRRQFGLNGRPRRCIARRHPSVPDGVHLSEIRHVGDPDIG